MIADDLRDCLVRGDAVALAAIWARLHPDQPQPSTPGKAEIMLHYARTAAASVPLALRRYSHAWLLDRAQPSALPPSLWPRPPELKIVEAVAVGSIARSPASIDLSRAVQRAMADKAAELQADGVKDPEFIRREMLAARAKVRAQ